MIHLVSTHRAPIHVPVILRGVALFSSIGRLAWISSCRAAMASSSTSSPSSTQALTSRIAVAQLCSTSNKYQNLMNIAKCAGQARQQQACMLFLPENCGFMGIPNSGATLMNAEPPIITSNGSGITSSSSSSNKNSEMVTQALMERVQAFAQGKGESIDNKKEDDENSAGPLDNTSVFLLDGLSNIARASNLWISVGGIHERGAPPRIENDNDGESSSRPRTFNTHVILDNEGQVRAIYRKIHLFDVSIPGKVNLQESASTAPGDQIVTCDSPIGRLGLSTCYDVRFPEQYIELVKRGAQILLVPSAFTVPTGTAHWHVLLRARAIENQCYVIAAAQSGKHNEKRESYGHALVVDPWGTIVVDAGGVDDCKSNSAVMDDETNDEQRSFSNRIVVCDIDLEPLTSIRQRMPIQQHRNNAKFQ